MGSCSTVRNVISFADECQSSGKSECAKQSRYVPSRSAPHTVKRFIGEIDGVSGHVHRAEALHHVVPLRGEHKQSPEAIGFAATASAAAVALLLLRRPFLAQKVAETEADSREHVTDSADDTMREGGYGRRSIEEHVREFICPTRAQPMQRLHQLLQRLRKSVLHIAEESARGGGETSQVRSRRTRRGTMLGEWCMSAML
jgi:hypothetical protein